ncbi:hypothetical protein DNTS_021624 [Danionella cerebrum]|uniref:Uncharacterized protein n=1 Tax=Danionella cerebrum TaxID=2873325 RepID=A0A553QXR1_9TELE|nr:hypothetical protein DNTS_021624 [Danionella translucida]
MSMSAFKCTDFYLCFYAKATADVIPPRRLNLNEAEHG